MVIRDIPAAVSTSTTSNSDPSRAVSPMRCARSRVLRSANSATPEGPGTSQTPVAVLSATSRNVRLEISA